MNTVEKQLPPSLWVATAEPGPRCPALSGSEEADVVIVGAGFTGLSAALHLAEAGKSVRVLEAAEPGWGASGRNGGQVNPGWKIDPGKIAARYGAELGRRIVAMAGSTCDLVFELIERHQMRCDAVRPGYVQGAMGKRGIKILEHRAKQWLAWGAPVELLDKQQTAMLLGTESYDGALLDYRGGNIQPLSYARGLARAATAAGAVIHGDTPATALKHAGTGWRVTTPNGVVRAEQVLLCTNGYTDQLWPGLRTAVVPVASVITATQPLSDNVLKSILPGKHAVSETRRVQVYYRLDREGRFVIGGRGRLLNATQTGDDVQLRAAAHELFPQLAGCEWEYQWGGNVAMTWNHTPKLLHLALEVFAGLGYNGRGVAMATMMGKQLALAALGDNPDMPSKPLIQIPLHGFRQLGVSWRLLTGRWLDSLDKSVI